MKKSIVATMAAGIFIAVLGVAGSASASQNIGWEWNSGDHDSKGEFVALGEHFHGIEYHDTNYLKWSGPIGGGKWYIPGVEDGTQKDLDLSMAEGKVVTLQVCQEHAGVLPDDCNTTQTGVS
jgi:hypothetical protein